MNASVNSRRAPLPGCSVLPPFKPQAQTALKPIETRSPDRPANRQTGNRFAVINTFIDSTLRSLNRNEAYVWFVLWRDERDGVVRTSMTDIARRAGAHRRTVVRAVKRLQKLGLIEIVNRGSLNRGPSTYRIRPLPIEHPNLHSGSRLNDDRIVTSAGDNSVH